MPPAASNRRLLGWVVALLAPPLVLFVYPMISLIARNEEYFAGDYAAGIYVYAAGTAYAALGAALWLWARRSRIATALLLAYLLTAPAGYVHGVARGASASVLVTGAVLVMIAAATLLLLRRPLASALRVFVVAGVVLIVGVGAMTAAAVIDGAPASSAAAAQDRDDTASGDLPNVYHLILDEFQTDLFGLVLDDAARRDLAGFTWYPAATTPYGRTEMALASMFAPADYDYRIAPADFIDRAYAAPDGWLQRLTDAGYRTTGYIHHLTLYGGRSPFEQTHVHRDVAGSVGQRGYAELALSLWVYATAPAAISQRFLPEHHYQQLSGRVLLPDDAPAISVQSFGAFLRAEPPLSDTNRYTNVHLMVPHFPDVLNPRCEYLGGDITGPRQQAACALRLIRQLVEELRRLDRLSSSIVVVQGDHGSRFRVDGDEVIFVGDDGYSEAFSTARSRPLLLVKPPGPPTAEALATSQRPVEITDVMPTIFDAAGLPVPGGPQRDDRTSVLAETFPRRPVRHYHFYEKDRREVVDGDLQRFIIRDGAAEFDRAVPVP